MILAPLGMISQQPPDGVHGKVGAVVAVAGIQQSTHPAMHLHTLTSSKA